MASGKKSRGLTFKDKKGYKRYSNSGKSVHRHVAERMLGRKLRKPERVHHKDGNKENSRRSNLRVFPSQKAHHEHHKKNKKKFGFW